MNRNVTIVVHGFGTFAIVYRHLIELAKREAPHIKWAMILPTSHHLDVIREVLDDASILCLENEQARATPRIDDLAELSAYGGNVYADIEAEKKVFKHRPGREQLSRAVEIYRIYKRFLLRMQATHILLSQAETYEANLLSSLAAELGIPAMEPTSLRNLGGLYFSRDTRETLPRHRRVTPELLDRAADFLARFRQHGAAANDFYAEWMANETTLPLYQKPWLRRAANFVRRTIKNPRLFEPQLFLTSIRYTFPKTRDRVRGVRAAYNATQFDIGGMDELPSHFVYYPLQTSPESSINTLEPYYVDQLRALDAIRLSMPSHFTLVVKEHPSTIDVRKSSFYGVLRRKAGIQIAHYRLPSLQLIRRAGMTISVTGSATLEAFLLGRPSLVLGHCFIAEYLGGICSFHDLASRMRHGLSHPPSDADITSAVAELLSIRYDCIFRPPDEEGQLAARPSNIRRLLHALLDHLDKLNSSLAADPRDATA